MTFFTVVERYRQYLLDHAKSTETARAYCTDAGWLIHEFSLRDYCDIQRLSSKEIQEHLTEFKPSTQLRKLSALKSFFSFLAYEGTPNDFTFQYPKKHEDELFYTYISPDEYQTIREASFSHSSNGVPLNPERNLALFDLLYGSGLKVKTAASLRYSQVDFHNKRLHGLEGYVIDIPLTEQSQGSLKTHCDFNNLSENDHIFKNRSGNTCGHKALRNIVTKYGEAVGKEISSGDLRWSYFINLAKRGTSFEEIIDFMGYRLKDPIVRSTRIKALKNRFLRFQLQQQLLTQIKT